MSLAKIRESKQTTGWEKGRNTNFSGIHFNSYPLRWRHSFRSGEDLLDLPSFRTFSCQTWSRRLPGNLSTSKLIYKLKQKLTSRFPLLPEGEHLSVFWCMCKTSQNIFHKKIKLNPSKVTTSRKWLQGESLKSIFLKRNRIIHTVQMDVWFPDISNQGFGYIQFPSIYLKIETK